MYVQRLHHFCNIHAPDDGPRSGRKYLGTNLSWEVYEPIPTGYHKIDAATLKDKYKKEVFTF